ncbi:hypothetical protein Hanom_Chr14g01265271 [Helianthus anomalus]
MLLFIDIYIYIYICCTDCFCQGTMGSLASSGIYDDVDPMEIASDDEFPHVVEIVSSNDEDAEDF